MEVSNFVGTQIAPLAIVCGYKGTVDVLSILNNAAFSSGLWQTDDCGPVISHLMSLDIVIENDLLQMTEEEVWDTHIISIIAELPKSFYVSSFTDGFVLEVSDIIRSQIVSFFDIINLYITIDNVKYHMSELMSTSVWTFRIRHGATIRPSTTIGGNLGLEVSYV